eukprot:4979867-Pleurochrysis_carterae.AAC.1
MTDSRGSSSTHEIQRFVGRAWPGRDLLISRLRRAREQGPLGEGEAVRCLPARVRAWEVIVPIRPS